VFRPSLAKNLLCEVATKTLEKNEEAVNFFYSESSLFIGARGGAVSRKHLESTVVKFPEDACPL
jgi:hypothetical protein